MASYADVTGIIPGRDQSPTSQPLSTTANPTHLELGGNGSQEEGVGKESLDCCTACAEGELSTTQVLWVTLITNGVFTVSQAVAAFMSNSVSLKGDSADMAVDTVTYALNVWVEKSKQQPQTDRAERRRVAWIEAVVVAISAAVLLSFAVALFVDAGKRIAGDAGQQTVEPVVVFVFASLNLVVDIVQATIFCRVFMRKGDISETGNVNLLSAAAHVFADTLRTLSELASSSLAVWFGLDAVQTDAWASFLVNTTVFVTALALVYSLIRRCNKDCELELEEDEAHAEPTAHKLAVMPAAETTGSNADSV